MKKLSETLHCNGQSCDVWHAPADSFDHLPDDLILKAHAVCFHDGKILLVNHAEWDIWGIPGGTRESGETLEETLRREIIEETNHEVEEFQPICYQKIVSPDNDVHYRIQYICKVRPLGEFSGDIDKSVHRIQLISQENSRDYIEKKEIRQIVLEEAINAYRKYYEN